MSSNEKQIDDLSLVDEDAFDALDEHIEALANPDEFYAKQTFRVVYQTNNFLLPQIRDLINGKELINIRPEYQRRLRWTRGQKSRLIESLLLNIPIPSIFLYESEAARYEVMDGQQRLNAIKEFMNNEFSLSSLNVLWPLNGISYSSCPPRIKRGLDRAVLTAVTLLLESDEAVQGKKITHWDVRRFIFDRLNTGGTRLNAQELRNAIYPGRFNDLIIEIARDSVFTRIWGIPPYSGNEDSDYYEDPKRQKNRLYSSMMDCQIVLRFFALRNPENIRGSMKGILDRCMEDQLRLSEANANSLKEEYLGRLKLADQIFAQRPFELLADTKGKARLSVALYDAVMIALDRLWPERDTLIAKSEQIKSALNDVLSNPETVSLITGQGNTAKYTKDRIDLVWSRFCSAAGI